jgi:DNA-directed RNA polymerase subunit RPC12/RpoP
MLGVDFKKCLSCGKPFIPKHARHCFCSRRCFWDNQKALNKALPQFICPDCKTKTDLDFSPKKNKEKWHKFICPVCGYKVAEDDKDYKVIKELRIELRSEEWVDVGENTLNGLKPHPGQ